MEEQSMNRNAPMAALPMWAGWAQADITPYGQLVALQGQYEERITGQVHDPLRATVLALGNEQDYVIWVSVDTCKIDQQLTDAVRERVIQQRNEIDAARIILFATHTHTAPYVTRNSPDGRWGGCFDWKVSDPGVMTPEAYLDFAAGQIANAVTQAWSGRVSAGIAAVQGYCVLGHNRRVVYQDGTASMYGRMGVAQFLSLEGTEDSGVELMYVFDKQKQPTGVVVNVACPSQSVENETYISADYWGALRRQMAERLGEGFFVLPMCAPCGDISPRDLLRKPDYSQPGEDPYALAQDMARRLAEELEFQLGCARERIQTRLPVTHRICPLRLPIRISGQRALDDAALQLAKLHQELGQDEMKYGVWEYIGAQKLHNEARHMAYQQQNPLLLMELHAVRIGDTAFANNPFELYLEYGMHIKAWAKPHQVFLAQLSGKTGGYLASARAIAGGSYSVGVGDGLCGPEAGRLLVQATVAEINGLFEA